MVEPEMVFSDLEAITNLAERLIKYAINYVLDKNNYELEYLENYEKDKENKKKIISKLKNIASEKFKKIEYSEVIKILEKSKKNFVFNDIK